MEEGIQRLPDDYEIDLVGVPHEVADTEGDSSSGGIHLDSDEAVPQLVEEKKPTSDEDDFEGLEHRQHLAERAYKQGTQYVSVDLILADIGMEKYSAAFIQADEDMIELFAMVGDEEVDQVLHNLDVKAGVDLPYDDRCKLWKALRYRWFRAPANAQSFIHRSEVPLLPVPKHDKRWIRDSNIDLDMLESDRQKMVIRKAAFDEIDGTTMVQEEIYVREPHLLYTLNGLEKTILFWMNQDPRKMSREDPREEVLMNWIKEIELECGDIIDRFKLKSMIKRRVYLVFLVIRFIFLLLTIFLFALAFIVISTKSSTIPKMERLLSSTYLSCSALYMCTFLFLTEVTKKRRRRTSNLENARKMHAQCKLLYSEMISFRLKTHYLRQAKINRYLDESKINVSKSRSAVEGSSTVFASPKNKRQGLGGLGMTSELQPLRSGVNN